MNNNIDIEFIGNFGKERKNLIIKKIENVIHQLNVDSKNMALEIQLVSDVKMQKINQKYRNINETTDVLSFPQTFSIAPIKLLGTIIISSNEAKKRDEQIQDLVVHGLMHLLGYDHENDPAKWQKTATLIDHNMGV